MKKITHYILYILIACTALLNIQCSENGNEKTPLPELVHAESVMFDHPDSALHILEDMPMPSARWDKENHALWCLLVTQAQYKRMMKIPCAVQTDDENPFRFPCEDSIRLLQADR